MYVVDKVVFYLGLVLVNFVNVLNFEKIVLGGGVFCVGEVLFVLVRDYFKCFVFFCVV